MTSSLLGVTHQEHPTDKELDSRATQNTRDFIDDVVHCLLLSCCSSELLKRLDAAASASTNCDTR